MAFPAPTNRGLFDILQVSIPLQGMCSLSEVCGWTDCAASVWTRVRAGVRVRGGRVGGDFDERRWLARGVLLLQWHALDGIIGEGKYDPCGVAARGACQDTETDPLITLPLQITDAVERFSLPSNGSEEAQEAMDVTPTP